MSPSRAETPQQFSPIRTVQGGATGSQLLHPVVNEQGTPVWQAGDTNVCSWEIDSVGWCHGDPSNRRDNPDIKGLVYLTDARVVVVSDHFASGTRYRAYGVGNQRFVAAAVTRMSQVKAQRAAAGTFLVAQMRLPWLKSVVFGSEREKKALRGEVRLCAQHLTAFGDPEPVLLIFGLKHASDTVPFVAEVVQRVRQDRYTWKNTTDAERAALDATPSVATLAASVGQLPAVQLAGAFRVMSRSALQGVHSARSFLQAPATRSA